MKTRGEINLEKITGSKNINCWIDKILRKTKDYQFETFLIGIRLEKKIKKLYGGKRLQNLKSNFNRPIGQIIEKKTKKVVDFADPDLMVIIDLKKEKVNLQIKPVFIYGRYRKFKRGIPQTRWYCRQCRGRGCRRCHFTGKMYSQSVEGLIKNSVINQFAARDVILHGHGREDIDVRMLGTGRPFVIEIKEPKIRTVDLKKLTAKVNQENQGKIEVFDWRYVDKKMAEKVKNTKAIKTYRAKIEVKENVKQEDVKQALRKLIGQINQQTPRRVIHRRADLKRIRRVYQAKLLGGKGCRFEIEVRCDGGLYIKELISGDQGRTKPSLTELLNQQAEVKELDVVGVDLAIQP